MRREYLEEMTDAELAAYAGQLGIELGKRRGSKSRIDYIEERRNRTAEVRLLGAPFSIPVRRMHDKRVSDFFGGASAHTDDEMWELLTDIMGKDQADALLARCTDEDGVVDNDAIALAVNTLLSSQELKNF